MLRGFTAQAALDSPRFCISSGAPEVDDNDNEFVVIDSEVNFEDTIPISTIEKLEGEPSLFAEHGHPIHILC